MRSRRYGVVYRAITGTQLLQELIVIVATIFRVLSVLFHICAHLYPFRLNRVNFQGSIFFKFDCKLLIFRFSRFLLLDLEGI